MNIILNISFKACFLLGDVVLYKKVSYLRLLGRFEFLVECEPLHFRYVCE